METDLVSDHILSLSAAQIPRRQLDTAITVLLLQASGSNRTLAYKGLRSGRYQLDSQFVVKLLKTSNRKVQWSIVRSPAFWHLPKRLYRRLFFRFWRLHRHDEAWRWVLGWSLHPFLMKNPDEGPFYAKTIWSIANDPDENIAILGLNSAHFMGNALTLEQTETLIALTRHDSEQKAFSAKSNAGSLYKNFKNLRPEVKTLLRAPGTIATLRIRHPGDSPHKWSAHNWCMTNMRKALRRARRGRIPRAVK